ncbi:MAG TPA: 2-C-methyl-D-erythritol 2,4-cyclodiphosphate synthase [Chloroflexota bacterium]
MSLRIGHGYDVHQLAAGRALVLGGVEVPHERGLAGHSDGDALTHAVIDALLGAAALGDIGQHFPNSDPDLAGISSLELLERVGAMLDEHGWRANNIDATIVAQAPRLQAHIPEMRRRLAAAVGLELDGVSVKATTTDHLGFAGREEGIAAYAVATIVPSPSGRGLG